MSEDVFHNQPKGGLTSHLFRGEDLRAATVVEGVTDEPVAAVCGTIRAYGPFEEGVPEEACNNCKRKIQNDDD